MDRAELRRLAEAAIKAYKTESPMFSDCMAVEEYLVAAKPVAIIELLDEIEYLKSEILRCRRKEVHMDGVIYAEIDGSQVFRLHNKIWQEVSKNQ